MKKIIHMIFVTGLFLILMASKVQAASVAGDSASLASSFRLEKKDIDEVRQFNKRLAIKAVLEKYDSVMVSEVDAFMKTCDKYSLDCYLLPSIAGVESYFGKFTYPGSNNPFGWGRGLIMFEDWSESIDTVGAGLKTNYIDRGATTVEEIGAIYCEGNTWAGKVRYFMKQFQAEEDKLSLYTNNFPVQL